MHADAYRNALDAAQRRIEVLESSRTACEICETRRRLRALAFRCFVRTVVGLVVALFAATVVTAVLFVLAFASLSGPWPGAS